MKLRDLLNLALDRVPQHQPLVCTNPAPDALHRLNRNRIRWTVSQAENDVLIAGETLACCCGYPMRRVQHPAGGKLKPERATVR